MIYFSTFFKPGIKTHHLRCTVCPQLSYVKLAYAFLFYTNILTWQENPFENKRFGNICLVTRSNTTVGQQLPLRIDVTNNVTLHNCNFAIKWFMFVEQTAPALINTNTYATPLCCRAMGAFSYNSMSSSSSFGSGIGGLWRRGATGFFYRSR